MVGEFFLPYAFSSALTVGWQLILFTVILINSNATTHDTHSFLRPHVQFDGYPAGLLDRSAGALVAC